MEHINKVEIRGNVGTVRLNEHNGKKVANLSVITELLYKSREAGAVSEATWHNVVAWSGREIADLDIAVVFNAGLSVIGDHEVLKDKFITDERQQAIRFSDSVLIRIMGR